MRVSPASFSPGSSYFLPPMGLLQHYCLDTCFSDRPSPCCYTDGDNYNANDDYGRSVLLLSPRRPTMGYPMHVHDNMML